MAENDETTAREQERAEAEARAQAAATATAQAAPIEDDEPRRADPSETLWVHSNRTDNRVALYEQNERHPMEGEAFVGGDGAALVARTGEVERLLREGLLIEIPEPPDDSRRKPLVVAMTSPPGSADQPGQPTRLGREVSEELVSGAGRRQVRRQQQQAPDQVPVPAGVVMPPEPRDASRVQTGRRGGR